MILYHNLVERFFRFALLLSAFASLLWFVFGSHSTVSLVSVILLGSLWFFLARRKALSLDSPRPR